MKVVKRNGKKEEVKLDKILLRVKSLSEDLKNIEPILVAQKVIAGIFDGITSNKIDELLADTAALMNDEHPDYGLLAGRILASSIHKETSASFYQAMKALYKEGSLGDYFIEKVRKYAKDIEKIIDYERDMEFDFFAIRTLMGKASNPGYLMRIENKIVERPQHLFMRVAVTVADDNIEAIKELYDLISQGYYTHGTPTLFNSGHKRFQAASCFLVQMETDSIEGIFNTAKEAALISKYSGGLGIHVSNLRASGSAIRGNNGFSNGIVPWMKIFNEVARAVNQCFAPETLVYTTTGVKQIKDVMVGDEVIGHDGHAHRVTHQLSSPYKGKMVELRLTKSMEPVRVTGEHPFFVLKDQQKEQSYSKITKRLESGALRPEWCDADKLTTDDMVAFPIPKFEKDMPEFSVEDCRFYGMMLGDGHITKGGYECGITLGESKDVEFVRNYLKVYQIHSWETQNERKCVQIRWSNTAHFKIKTNMLYDENGEKRILPSFLNLPADKTLQLIRGVLETDGCIDNEITLEMTSKNVIESIRYMCLRMGILTSGYLRTPRGGHTSKYGDFIEGKKQAYCIRIPKVAVLTSVLGVEASEKVKYFQHGDTLFSRIDEIKETEYEGEVYDFNVQTAKTYLTANGGLAHNGGKRKGSIAMYLEPWHADVESFLELPKEVGPEEIRARDLFLAMWTPDLFFKRAEKDEEWSLFCPDECPGMQDVYGAEFEALYTKYESEGKAKKKIKARDLLAKIAETQIEHGFPYMLAKDTINERSMQKNIGVIKSSNLCLKGDTLVLTKEGYSKIEDLVGKTVEVFDGSQWVTVSNFTKTKENANLVQVTLRDGSTLKTTPYHKFVLENGELIEAKNLTVGAELKAHGLAGLAGLTGLSGLAGLAGLAKAFFVKEVKELDEVADVYCCNVPTTHQFALACGIMTGNCAEIVEVSTPDETAVCNLASVGLSRFVKEKTKEFDFKKLEKVVRVATRNLNNVIDRTFYPTDKTKISNLKHRPIGIGVQGLADVFFMLDMAFDSAEALKLDTEIFETMYFGFLSESMELAKRDGPYESFAGSPASQGILMFDMYGVTPSDRHDWATLKKNIMEHGLRNSLGIALMPTASTASIFGNIEAFEPQKGNIFKREVLSGEFMMVNKHLVKALQKRGLWNSSVKNKIIANRGSVQNVNEVPDDIKAIYKTAYEIKQRNIIDHAAARQAFVDQSQSMNLFFEDCKIGQLSSALQHGWKSSLKTLNYYIRSKTKARAAQVGEVNEQKMVTAAEAIACSIDNKEDCEVCSS